MLGLALGLGLAHCSLLAPSDADLMKGNQSLDASDAADASDDASGEASDDAADGARDAAECLPLGFFCNGQPQRCCSGTCNGAAGKKCD